MNRTVHTAEALFDVTVLVDGNTPETMTVAAATASKATSSAIAVYHQKLAGQPVHYEVREHGNPDDVIFTR